MNKQDVLRAVRRAGIVAIVRCDSKDEAIALAEACIAGGITVLEVAFTTPGALEAVRELRARHDGRVLVGAGTVLDAATARAAIEAGAQFIISPGVNADTIRACVDAGVAAMPGALTPTEILAAVAAGADIVKVFPADAMGPHYIAALRGPLPDVPLMPTGGVTLENLAMWFRHGAMAVGVGGSLTAPAKKGNYTAVTSIACAFVQRMREIGSPPSQG